MNLRRAQRGFSLLELVIVVILVILLFLVAQDRLLPLRGAAEGTKVATVVGAMRSSLGLEVSRRILEGGAASVAGLQGANPMELLQSRPAEYLGERAMVPAEAPEGSWYYHPGWQVLVYRVRFPGYLEGKPEGPVALRWRVRLSYDNRDDRAGFDSEADQLRGVRLAPLDEYSWPNIPRAGLIRSASRPPASPG